MEKTALLVVAMFVLVASTVVAEERIEDASTNYLYGTCMDFVYQDKILLPVLIVKHSLKES